MWYVMAKPCHASVLRIRVHDLGRIEGSRRCCTGLAFMRVLIFPTSRGHLTLAVTSRGSPRGAGISSCLVRL